MLLGDDQIIAASPETTDIYSYINRTEENTVTNFNIKVLY